MRLPCSPTAEEKTHFLTDFYVSHFDLNSVRFVNSCKEAYLKFYNMKKAVRIKGKQNEKCMHANIYHLFPRVQKISVYINIQFVNQMNKQQDHMLFPKRIWKYPSYKILINIISSYFEMNRASLFN